MRRVLGLIETTLCPKPVVEAAYHYAIGCFWVKFSPIFEPAHTLLDSILPQAPDLMKEHLGLTQALGQLLYISDDNSTLMPKLIQTSGIGGHSLFISDAVPASDFVQVRDFYLQIVKCGQSDLCLSKPELAREVLSGFDNLMLKEYQNDGFTK